MSLRKLTPTFFERLFKHPAAKCHEVHGVRCEPAGSFVAGGARLYQSVVHEECIHCGATFAHTVTNPLPADDLNF